MRQIKKGSTSISVDVYIIDSTDGTPELGVLFSASGMDLEYRREGAVVVNITEVTLAALTTAWTTGGFLEIGHGYYRLDVPDLAFATGANTVSVQGTVTGMIVLPQTIQLVDFDPEDGVRLGLTSMPAAAAEAPGGLFTRGTSAGQINQATDGQIDSNQVRIVNTVVPAPNTAGIPDVNVLEWVDTTVPAPNTAGVPDVNVQEWKDEVVPAPAATGVPDVNVTHFVDGAAPATAATGVPDVNTTHWIDGVIPAQGVTGVPEVNITHQVDTVVPAPSTAGIPDVNVKEINDNATPALVLEDLYGAAIRSTADSGGTNALVDTALSEATSDFWRGALLIFRSGTNAGHTAVVIDFNPGLDQIVFSPDVPSGVTTEDYTLIPALGYALVEAWDGTAVNPLSGGDVSVNVNRWLTGTPNSLNAGLVQADVERWTNQSIPATAAAGVPDVNVTHQGDGAIPAPANTGVPDVNVSHQGDGAIPAPAATGVPDVNTTHWIDGAIPTQNITGTPEVDIVAVEGTTTITEVTQGIPPATPGLLDMFGWWWAQWRNDSKVTSSERQVAGDDGVVRAKAPMSDDGSEFSPGELISGP